MEMEYGLANEQIGIIAMVRIMRPVIQHLQNGKTEEMEKSVNLIVLRNTKQLHVDIWIRILQNIILIIQIEGLQKTVNDYVECDKLSHELLSIIHEHEYILGIV